MTPTPNSPTAMKLTFTAKVARAWDVVPDWILELAASADRHGLKDAGASIHYSDGAVSQVLANKYRGDLARVEDAVRGALMGLNVECPVLGTIGRDRCLDEQKQPFRATSAFRAQLYHACRGGCPNARSKGDSDA